MKVFCSWSGGKDSCLSCFKAILEGHRAEYLFTMFSTTGRCTRFHLLSRELLLAQSQAIGIPLYHKRALAFFKREDVESGVFGNLYLNEHREWVEKVCAEAGIIPLLPLWGMEGKDLLRQFIEAGFEAVVTAVQADLLSAHWLGRRIDEEFINEIEKEGMDTCGEEGEYHTFVVDGPIFKKRIAIKDTKVIKRKKISFLELLDFEMEEKELFRR